MMDLLQWLGSLSWRTLLGQCVTRCCLYAWTWLFPCIDCISGSYNFGVNTGSTCQHEISMNSCPGFPVILNHGRYLDTSFVPDVPLCFLYSSSNHVVGLWRHILVESASNSCWSGCVCCWTTRLRLILASDIAWGSTADPRPGSKFGFNEIWTRYFGACLGSNCNKWIQIQHSSSLQPSGSWGSFWSLEGRSSKSLAKDIGGSCPCSLSQWRGTLRTQLGTEVSQHSRVSVLFEASSTDAHGQLDRTALLQSFSQAASALLQLSTSEAMCTKAAFRTSFAHICVRIP